MRQPETRCHWLNCVGVDEGYERFTNYLGGECWGTYTLFATLPGSHWIATTQCCSISNKLSFCALLLLQQVNRGLSRVGPLRLIRARLALLNPLTFPFAIFLILQARNL